MKPNVETLAGYVNRNQVDFPYNELSRVTRLKGELSFFILTNCNMSYTFVQINIPTCVYHWYKGGCSFNMSEACSVSLRLHAGQSAGWMALVHAFPVVNQLQYTKHMLPSVCGGYAR